MRLKLWEKSFLLTFTVFLILLNTGLVMWYLFDVRNDYQKFADDCRQEAESILYFGERMSSESTDARELEEIADRYADKGVYIKLIAAVVGALLYAAMRKIYKPVSDISHELRTPLTSVSGYAQYLSMQTATEEEKAFAGEQIVKEAK